MRDLKHDETLGVLYRVLTLHGVLRDRLVDRTGRTIGRPDFVRVLISN